MKNILVGFFIGIGAILPGVSSGVFCVIFGIYEKLINTLLHFFKNIKENFIFLLQLSIGVFLGIFILGNMLKFVYSKFYMQTCFCFIGLILGCIPSIIKQANITRLSFSHVLCFFVFLTLSLYLILLEKSKNIVLFSTISHSYCSLILTGFIMSAGIVIPGISKTVILMLLRNV